MPNRPVIDEVLKALGYAQVMSEVYQRDRDDGGDVLFVGGPLEEFLDAFYARAHKDGFERGAYEEQQQEDVEKPTAEKTRVEWLKGEVDYNALVAKHSPNFVIVDYPPTPKKKQTLWGRWFG